MTLYDKLKDKEALKDLQPDVIDALKSKSYCVELTFYEVCKIHWHSKPNSNDISIYDMHNLFID